MLTLEDASAKSRVEILPERGGLVTRFSIDEREVLNMDDATLADPTKNVRGGLPVLFPSPGKLTNDHWRFQGDSGTLPQHGFARNRAWQVDRADSEIVLSLGAHDEPDDIWPWTFSLRHRFSLVGRTLRIDQEVTNRADGVLPCGLGFHPYFQVPHARKANVTVETGARRAWDNTTKQVIDISRIELGAGEVDLHLLDHGRSDCSLHLDGELLVRLDCSPEYQTWVIWTLPMRDFVCLEPWTCPFDALNTGEKLIQLESGESRQLFVSISA